MSQGIQIWDGGGNIMLDTTDRVTQLFGAIEIPEDSLEGSGSIADDRLTRGTPFWFVNGNLGIRSGSTNGNGTKNGFWMSYPDSYPYNCEARNFVCTFNGPVMSWRYTKAALNGGFLKGMWKTILYYGCF